MATSLVDYYNQINPYMTASVDPYAPQGTLQLGLPTPEAQSVAAAYPQRQQVQPYQDPNQIWYNPGRNTFNVGGNEFTADNDTAIANYEYYQQNPGNVRPEAGAVPVDSTSWGQMVNEIRNPSTWRLAKKNFGIGVDQLQQLGGYGAMFMGAEDYGRKIVEAQNKDLEKTAVYNRDLDDIGERGLLNWLVANVAQQGPNLIISALSGGTGGLAGGAVRGAAGAALRGVGGLGVRMAGKEAVTSAAISAAEKYAAGQALSAAEKNLLLDVAKAAATNSVTASVGKAGTAAGLEFAASKAPAMALAQQRAGGAMLGNFATNMGMAIGDLYGEGVESGDPSRLQALALAPAYAALESIPEVGGAAWAMRPRGLGKVTAGAAKAPEGFMRRAAGRTGNVLLGMAGGAAGEGLTELGQEELVMSMNPNLTDAEKANRRANAAAAGAGVGAFFGGAAGAFRRKLSRGEPASLLDATGGQVDPGIVKNVVSAIPGIEQMRPQQQIMAMLGKGFTHQQAVDVAEHLYTARTNAVTGQRGLRNFSRQTNKLGSAYTGQYDETTGHQYATPEAYMDAQDAARQETQQYYDYAAQAQNPLQVADPQGLQQQDEQMSAQSPQWNDWQTNAADVQERNEEAVGRYANYMGLAGGLQQLANQRQAWNQNIGQQNEAEMQRIQNSPNVLLNQFTSGQINALQNPQPQQQGVISPDEANALQQQIPQEPSGILTLGDQQQAQEQPKTKALTPKQIATVQSKSAKQHKAQLEAVYKVISGIPPTKKDIEIIQSLSDEELAALHQELNSPSRWIQAIQEAKPEPEAKPSVRDLRNQRHIERAKQKAVKATRKQNKLQRQAQAKRLKALNQKLQNAKTEAAYDRLDAERKRLESARQETQQYYDYAAQAHDALNPADAQGLQQQQQQQQKTDDRVEILKRRENKKRIGELNKRVKAAHKQNKLQQQQAEKERKAKEAAEVKAKKEKLNALNKQVKEAHKKDKAERKARISALNKKIKSTQKEIHKRNKLLEEQRQRELFDETPSEEEQAALQAELEEEQAKQAETPTATPFTAEQQAVLEKALAGKKLTKADKETLTPLLTAEYLSVADVEKITAVLEKQAAKNKLQEQVESAAAALNGTNTDQSLGDVLERIVNYKDKGDERMKAINLVKELLRGTQEKTVVVDGKTINIADILTPKGNLSTNQLEKAVREAKNDTSTETQEKPEERQDEQSTTGEHPAKKFGANTKAGKVVNTIESFFTGTLATLEQAKDILGSIRSDGLSNEYIPAVYQYIVDNYDAVTDKERQSELRGILRNAAVAITSPRVGFYYRKKLTRIGQLLEHMGVLDTAEKELDAKKTTVPASTNPNAVIVSDDKIRQDITKARQANAEKGETSQAWDWIEELTSEQESISNVLDIFDEAIKETDITEAEARRARRIEAVKTGLRDQVTKLSALENPNDAQEKLLERKNKRREIALRNAMRSDVAVKYSRLTPDEIAFIEKKLGVGKLVTEDGEFNDDLIGKLFDNTDPVRKANGDFTRPKGMMKRVDGSTATPMAKGAVQLAAKSFVSKLAVKPNLHVYSNAEELKKQNPALYKQAVAANPDFGKREASGYAFGNNVIIFSDNIYSNDHLNTVLSHESLGHIGLRSIMDDKSLTKLLDDVYNSSEEAKKEVKRLMDMYGISKQEATEEYLADKAASLDNSLFRRVWATIKRFLNKLGLKFDDDMALAVIHQCRRYVREGRLDNNSKALGAKINVGRFMAVDQSEIVEQNQEDALANVSDLHYDELMRMNGPWSTYGLFDKTRQVFSEGASRNGFAKMVTESAAKIASQLRTLNDLARECFGLESLYNYFNRRTQMAERIKSEVESMRVETRSAKTTTADKEMANKMLAYGTLHASANIKERFGKVPDIIVKEANGNRRVVNEEEIKKILETDLIPAEEFAKGLTYKDALGKEHKADPIPVTKDSQAYKVYVENVKAVRYIAIQKAIAQLQKAENATENFNQEIKNIFAVYNTETDKTVAETCNKFADLYMRLIESGVKVTDAGIKVKEGVTQQADELLRLFTKAITDKQTAQWFIDGKIKSDKAPKEGGLSPKLRTLLKDGELDFIRVAMPKIADTKVDERAMLRFRNVLKLRAMNSMGAVSAERKVKETIARAYVPFVRRGSKQLILAAYDKEGNRVDLHHSIAGVMPRFHGEQPELQRYKADLEKLFDKDYTVVNSDGEEVQVTFKTQLSDAEITAPLAAYDVDLRDFIDMLASMGINLDALTMQTVIRSMAGQSNQMMHNLLRRGNPGFDPNAIRSIAEYSVRGAHEAAAVAHQNTMTNLFMDGRNWHGDKFKLKTLAAAVKAARTDAERRLAQRNYDAYAYMYMHMAPEGEKVMVGGKERDTLGRGNYYKERAKELIQWSNNRSDVNTISNDILSSGIGGKLRSYTVMAQLGGSIAAGVINLTSLVTNALPYFATYNNDTAYGLGHGFARSMAMLTRAVIDMKNYKLSDANYLQELLNNKDWAKHGLTEQELQFLLEQTKSGGLQAAQYNHLMGDMLGRTQNNLVLKGIKAWMSAFSYTEELNRRATALAAFRGEIARGATFEEASRIAMKTTDTTQGNYSAYNRPAIGRHNIGQYMYMYKQFPITCLQLLKGMSWKGRTAYLGMLLVASGMKGVPFADDLLDIIDTLCQALGIKMGSVEAAAAEFIDDLAPGMTPYVMRGLLDRVTGATISTRLGMGDLIPLTEVFKAGNDKWRSAQNFGGAMVSGMTGTIGMAMSLGRFGLEKTGIREGHTSFNQILRESPVAAFRMMGDAAAYATDGTVTNITGAVIRNNASGMDVAMRLMGFYPSDATLQNDVVRMSKQKDAYMKETKAHFVGAYTRAVIAGNMEEANAIKNSVREYNNAAKQVAPDMVIKDFNDAARRAVKAAKLPTGERHLKTAAKTLRDSEEQLLAIYGYPKGALE